MPPSKTASPLPSKAVFDVVKAQAAEAVMQGPLPTSTPPAVTGARNRKAGGRGVRISGYVPPEIDEALRDEVIRRINAERRTVSFNDVLCSILADWLASRKQAP